MCYEERELADLKHPQKKLDLCLRHIPEAIESPFARLLCSYKYHVLLFIKFAQKFGTYAYRVELLQVFKPEDKPRRKDFAVSILGKLGLDPGFLKLACLSNKSTLHVSGMISRPYLKVWGFVEPSQNPGTRAGHI